METIQIDDRRLDVAIEAAMAAGDRAASMKETTVSEVKGNKSVVTAADREAEEIVREQLIGEFEWPILGEEGGGDITDTGTYWVVDPIDGTWNFTQGQPFYGCSVALVDDHEPVIGVWYMPDLGELFYAVEGEEAYRWEEQVEVSEDCTLSDAYPTVSGYGSEKFHRAISECTYPRGQRFGSAVMAQAWVATGWCDVGVVGALRPWDMAAGIALIREAGGVMKNVKSGESDWESLSEGRTVFGRESIVDELRAKLTAPAIDLIEETEYGR